MKVENKRSKRKEGSDPEVNPLPSLKTVWDLPEEILAQIFGYLTHTQKLISRLVCKEWNERISSDLPKTSYFELTSRKTNEILIDSNVEWTHIKISDCRHVVLTTEFKKSITTLQLDLLKFGSSSLMRFLVDFPSLTELEVNINEENEKCEDPFPHEDRATQILIFRPDFLGIMEKLKELSVTFPHQNYQALNQFLEELPDETMCLTKLSIVENNASRLPSAINGSSADVLTYLNQIITASSKTLRSLCLDFISETISRELVPGVISQLSEVKNLKLETVLIECNPDKKDIERDFAILQEFLNIQMTTGVLKNIILPWSSNVSLCQDFVNSLPLDIESVGDVRSEHVTQEFPSKFKKLKYLSLGEDISNEMSDNNVQVLRVDLRKYDFIFDPEVTFCENITDGMSNLTNLQIVGNGSGSFSNSDLHYIIDELKELRVLHLESCKLTDRGVTGDEVDNENIQQSIPTKRFYLYPKCFHENHHIKNSISSLRKLETLVLTCSKITDVGIVLGFQFGTRLKQLVLGSKSKEISDLGLHCLAINNPGLEVFEGSFKSSQISVLGIENMKKQLPLIQSTQKFKFLNETS